MQVDCYKRNFGTNVCSKKCKFVSECVRQAVRDLQRIEEKKQKERQSEELIG